MRFWCPRWRLHLRGVSAASPLCSVRTRSQQLIRRRRRRRGKDFSARSQRGGLLARCLPARVVDADSAVNACDPVFVLAGRVSGRPPESSAFIAVPSVPRSQASVSTVFAFGCEELGGTYVMKA
ncbi:hypothetical protein MTO96_013405 [Rhipicephalus appendiculatus]